MSCFGSAQHVDDRADDGEVSPLLTSTSGTISTAWQVQSLLALSRRYRARSSLIFNLAREAAGIGACFPYTGRLHTPAAALSHARPCTGAGAGASAAWRHPRSSLRQQLARTDPP